MKIITLFSSILFFICQLTAIQAQTSVQESKKQITPNFIIGSGAENGSIRVGTNIMFKLTQEINNMNPTDIKWNFGDGTTSQQNQPNHSYKKPGTFTVSVSFRINNRKYFKKKINFIESYIREVKTVKGGNWKSKSTWRGNTIPGPLDKVTITHPVNIPSNAKISVSSITTTGQGKVTLLSGVNGQRPSLIIKKKRSKIRIEHALSPQKYHYISYPIIWKDVLKKTKNTEGKGRFGLNTKDVAQAFFRWNEPTSTWIDLLHLIDDQAKPRMDTEKASMGLGYAYSDTPISHNKIAFEGLPLDRDLSIVARYTADQSQKGFNLIGNPYCSDLAINNKAQQSSNFIKDNKDLLDPHYQGIYIWNESEEWDGKTDHYLIYSNSGFVGESETEAKFITLGQAFMIRVKKGGKIIFKKSSRCHSTGVQFYKKEEKSWPGVELSISNANSRSITSIGFNNQMSEKLDPSYDMASMMQNTAINIYSSIEGDDTPYAIQSKAKTSESTVINLKVIEAGEYTFKAYTVKMNRVILEDKNTGEFITLRNNSSYTVDLEAGDIEERFILHHSPEGQENATEDIAITKQKIYSNDNILYLEHISGEVRIYNLMGQCVDHFECTQEYFQKALHLTHGTYLVHSKHYDIKITL